MALASPLLHVWVPEEMKESGNEPMTEEEGAKVTGNGTVDNKECGQEDRRDETVGISSVTFPCEKKSVRMESDVCDERLTGRNGHSDHKVPKDCKAGKMEASFSLAEEDENVTNPIKLHFPQSDSQDEGHWSRGDYSHTFTSPLPPSSPPLSTSEEASIFLADFISEIGMKMKSPVPTLVLPPPTSSPPHTTQLHSSLIAETSPRSLLAKHRTHEVRTRKRVRWADSDGASLTRVFSAHSRYVYDRRPAVYAGRRYDDLLPLNLSSVCVLLLMCIAVIISYLLAS